MSYKRLGNYIRQVNIRNKDLETETLLGVSITKKLIPSIANIIGTDMSNYKIIKRRQFAYGTVTSRNGDKISIALSDQYDKALVSQIYIVFEVINTDELLPEYLMMWFSRPEFDRYARFHSHGSTRETFDWEDMCDVELPIPSIEEQNKIVTQYQSIENKIKVNEQICEKLEATAQTLYKHWFVDFEFPNEDEKPYKSSDGKMVWNEELGKEIPEGWEVTSIGEITTSNSENLKSTSIEKFIYYLDTSSITNNRIDTFQYLNLAEDEIPSRAKRIVKENDIIFSTVRPNLRHFGLLKNIPQNLIVSTGFCVLRSNIKDIPNEVIYLSIIQEDVLQYLQGKAEMSVSTYPSITSDDLLAVKICIPTAESNLLVEFQKIYNFIDIQNVHIKKLTQLQSLLLSRLAVGEEMIV